MSQVRLSKRLRRGLARYAKATAALGAGAALAPAPAEGAIIFTNSGAIIGPDGTSVAIDFDGVGAPEFVINSTELAPGNKSFTLATDVGATGQQTVGLTDIARLSLGDVIGPASAFGSNTIIGQGSPNQGNWASGAPGDIGFIGAQFDLGSGPRYGWVYVGTKSPSPGSPLLLAVQSYAYEDTGLAILAGDTGAAAVPEPSTMALLALGAAGMLAWRAKRRRREVPAA